eukprot:gene16523-22409_t
MLEKRRRHAHSPTNYFNYYIMQNDVDCMLMDGLARLGVGATYSVTQLMMQLIGGL